MTDLARYQDPQAIQRVLHTASTVAIVGLSKNELRASYFVGYYLKRHGYRVIPVNPRESEILGETCYPSLLDVPVPVDIVDVFRAPDALPGIARDAVKIGASTLWCQFGVINAEGAQIAADAGCTGWASIPSGSPPSGPGFSSPRPRGASARCQPRGAEAAAGRTRRCPATRRNRARTPAGPRSPGRSPPPGLGRR
jgi:predicted CoA-binding protein